MRYLRLLGLLLLIAVPAILGQAFKQPPVKASMSQPTAEKQELKLQQIEREDAIQKRKQKQLTAILADNQRSIEAVNSDFAAGRLSSAERDLLLRMFAQREEEAKQKLQEGQR